MLTYNVHRCSEGHLRGKQCIMETQGIKAALGNLCSNPSCITLGWISVASIPSDVKPACQVTERQPHGRVLGQVTGRINRDRHLLIIFSA